MDHQRARGSLLIELCISIAILALMGTLSAYIHSRILLGIQAMKDDLQMLFLARSALEEYKAFGDVRSHHKEFNVGLYKRAGAIQGYEEVTVSIAPLVRHYSGRARLDSKGGRTLTITTGCVHD